MVDSLLFFISNLCALVVAARIALAMFPPSRPWSMLTALLGAYVLVASGVTLTLGVAGLLRPLPAVAVLLVLATPSALWLRRWMVDPTHRRLDGHRFTDGLRALPAGLVGAFAALTLFWLAAALGAGIYLSVDDRVYHAANAAEWIVSGRIGLTPFTYQSYFPLNAEVFCAWFMLPFGNDAVVGLTGAVYAALVVVATTGMLRRVGVSLSVSLLASVVVLSSTFVIDYCDTFSDVDFGAPAVMIAAISLAAQDVRRRPGHGIPGRSLLAGSLAGFAVGMKVPFAPLAIVVLVVTTVGVARSMGWAAAARTSGAFCVGLVTFGGYFYARNLVVTGSPLYPAQLGPFSGPFLAAEQGRSSLVGLLTSAGGSSYLRPLLRQIMNWPFTHATLVAAGVVASLVLALSRRLPRHDYARAARTMLLVGIGVVVLVFPFQPFSGVNELGHAELNSRRYLMFPFLAGAVLMAEVVDVALTALRPTARRWALSSVAVLLLVPLVLRSSSAVAACLMIVVGIGAALAAAGWLSRFAARSSRWLSPRRALVLGLLGPLMLVSSLADTSLARTDRRLLTKPLERSLEALPRGSGVARFDTRDGYVLRSSYPLFGRRLQLRPVAVLADGTAAPLLHRRARYAAGSFWAFASGESEGTVKADQLVDHLRDAGVDYVVTAPDPFSGQWPRQHVLLESSARAVPLVEGPDGAIFGLRDPTRQVASFLPW